MSKHKKKLTWEVALAALLGGSAACAESGEAPTIENSGDPVEAEIANLGIAITGCSGSGYTLAGKILELQVSADPLVLSTTGGYFSANGIRCKDAGVGAAAKELRVADVTKLVIKGDDKDNKVILDFLPGTFGAAGVLSATGGIGVRFDLVGTGTTSGNDSLMIRAGATAETYKFASLALLSAPTIPTNVYIEVSGDKNADVEVRLGTTGKLSMVASMGGGNDVVVGNATTTDITTFAGALLVAATSPTTALSPLPATLGITAYGGPGDDTFTGGNGDDAFYGGDGADKFKTLATADGADIYSGDVGDDTIEYTDRTQPLRVDVGPQRPAIEGSVDLRDPSLYGASGVLNGKTLVFSIDGKHVSVTFTGSTTLKPQDIVDAINTAANATTVFPNTNTASPAFAALTGKNHLVLRSRAASGANLVKIELDPGIATATTGAEAAATFNIPLSGSTVTATAVGGSSITAFTGSSVDAKRLLLRINGVYVATVFDVLVHTDSTLIVKAINDNANAALGTVNVKYASEAAGTGFLTLNATSVEVLDGTLAFGATSTAAAALGLLGSTEGKIDLKTLNATSFYSAAGTLEGDTLSFIVDGARVETTFASAATANDVVSQINTAAQAVLGGSGVYATLNPANNHLVLSSLTDAANSAAVQIVGDPLVLNGNSITTTAEAAGALNLVGQKGPKLVTNDMTASTYLATTQSTRLVLVVNGTYVTVEFGASLANPEAVVTAINAAATTAGVGNIAVYNTTTKKIELSAVWINVKAGTYISSVSYVDAASELGLGVDGLLKTDVYDSDDGEAGERDDVRYSTENITGGTKADVLIGNDQKNTIKGGDGNDSISGGANVACLAASADQLQGLGGDDTFFMPTTNCKATLVGGDGNNVADFSGRSDALKLTNNGTADDGVQGTTDAELANIGSDIKTMIGGFGADAIIGGTSDDTLVGGPGADLLVGGAGVDTVDYSAATALVNVSLCHKATPAMASATASIATLGTAWVGTSPVVCNTANDGMAGELDQVAQIEHVIGSKFNDILSGGTDPLAP
ncbi:MAG: hypothetical protein RL701_6609, partial [Pseudomonadota bacterium]